MPVLLTTLSTALSAPAVIPAVGSAVSVPVLASTPALLVRVLATLTVAWLVLLGLSLAAHITSQAARERASHARINAGVPTMMDVLTLMRDKMDETGAPFWPQRHLLSNTLVRGDARPADARLVVAWVQAGQPIPRLITYRQAGFSDDQISRHASGATFIDPTTAATLAALRT